MRIVAWCSCRGASAAVDAMVELGWRPRRELTASTEHGTTDLHLVPFVSLAGVR